MKKFKISTVAAIAVYAMLAAIAVYAMLAAGLSSCTGAFDSDNCMQAVQAEYPKAIVWKAPDKKYQFIVCDTCGAVYHVKTMDDNSTKITTKVVIKPCR